MHFFHTGRLIYDDCRLQLSALRQTELCLDWSICSSESGAQTVRLQVIAALETKINTLVKFSGPPDTLPRLQPASTLIRIQLDRRFIKKKRTWLFKDSLKFNRSCPVNEFLPAGIIWVQIQWEETQRAGKSPGQTQTNRSDRLSGLSLTHLWSEGDQLHLELHSVPGIFFFRASTQADLKFEFWWKTGRN